MKEIKIEVIRTKVIKIKLIKTSNIQSVRENHTMITFHKLINNFNINHLDHLDYVDHPVTSAYKQRD